VSVDSSELAAFFGSVMNTPRTRPIRRYGISAQKMGAFREGTFSMGLASATHLTTLGAIISRWVHVEERMCDFMSALLGSDPWLGTGRQVFRAIIANEARIAIMTALLEEHPNNRDKSSWFDDVLAEFVRLNRARNKYVHGIWETDEQKGIVYISEPNTDHGGYPFTSPRTVPITELATCYDDMSALERKLLLELNQQIELAASAQKSREQASRASSSAEAQEDK
jgi:hypothetical protein